MTCRALLLTLLLLAAGPAGTPVAEAQPDLSGDPGFIDFSQQGTLDDDDLEIHISVKDPMIKLVAEASRESDPVLADILDKLKVVEVLVYNVGEGQRKAVRGEISEQAGELEELGWTEAVAIRLRSARGHVFLRIIDDLPAGVAAMYLNDKDEAVFVNIVGQIDPAQVGRLASKFNLDLLSQAVSGSLGAGKSE